jgi:N-acetylmuramoyl-L-alanine amidase
VPVETPGAPAHRAGTIVDRKTGKGVAGAEILWAPTGESLGRANPDGAYAIPVPIRTGPPETTAADTLVCTAPGYLSLELPSPATTSELALDPVLGGVLHGRRVAVDAAGGGADPVFVSATGLRASDTALDVARRFARDLARAGGTAELVRDEDLTIPDLARVEVAEQMAADRYVRIGADRSPRIRHFPGSRRGETLARAVAREIEAETGLALVVRAEVSPVLLATSMPAIDILLPAPADPAREDQHLDPDFHRRVARALLLALATEAGLDLGRQATVRFKTPDPYVLLDGAVVIPTSGGEALGRGLEPSPALHEAASLGVNGNRGPGLGFRVAPDTAVTTITLEPSGAVPEGAPGGRRP